MDALIDDVRNQFITDKQLAIIRKVHKKYVNDALFLFVAHDVAPLTMSTRVKGFVEPQNWFVDFSDVSID